MNENIRFIPLPKDFCPNDGADCKEYWGEAERQIKLTLINVFKTINSFFAIVN